MKVIGNILESSFNIIKWILVTYFFNDTYLFESEKNYVPNNTVWRVIRIVDLYFIWVRAKLTLLVKSKSRTYAIDNSRQNIKEIPRDCGLICICSKTKKLLGADISTIYNLCESFWGLLLPTFQKKYCEKNIKWTYKWIVHKDII